MSQMRKAFFLVGTILFAVLFVQNVGMLGARLPFRFFHLEPMDLIAGYWFLIFIGFGLMLGGFFSMRSYWFHQKTIKALHAEIKHLNEELAKHRTLSLEEEDSPLIKNSPQNETETEIAKRRNELLDDISSES